ncbi:MAG: hypothetical protein IT445_19170 [Phycisphaeraceae bacterium]|nr:hypothetical protein [Phycisphaeraceae bacterium]
MNVGIAWRGACLVIALIATTTVSAEITTTGDVSPDPHSTTASDDLYVGHTADGTMLIDGDSDVASQNGYVGFDAGVTSQVQIDGLGSTWTNSNSVCVGLFGAGSLDVTSGGQLSATNSYIATLPGSTGHATIDGADAQWTNSSVLYLGHQGDGTLTIRNGGSLHNALAYLGYYSSTTGSATISGSQSTWINTSLMHIGYNGHGELIIPSGGLVDSGTIMLAVNDGSTGSISIDGDNSTLNAAGLTVGGNGTGVLSISNGGRCDVSYGLSIGALENSQGTVTVDGPGSSLSVGTVLYVGAFGHGVLNILNGGQVNCSWHVDLADQPGSSGQVLVQGNGSTLNCNDELHANGPLTVSQGGAVYVAQIAYLSDTVVDGPDSILTAGDQVDVNQDWSLAAASLAITHGGQVQSGPARISGRQDDPASVTVDGDGSVWTISTTFAPQPPDPGGYIGNSPLDYDLAVGYRSGTLAITNGGKVLGAKRARIAVHESSLASATVSGSGSTWQITESLHVGYGGNGTMEISDTGQVSSADSFIGFETDAVGSITVSDAGSTWTNSGNLTVGEQGDGTLNIVAGGQVIVEDSTFVRRTSAAQGLIQLDQGTLDTSTLLASVDDLQGQGNIHAHGLISNIDLLFDQTHGPQQQIILNAGSGQNVTIDLDQNDAGGLGAGYHDDGSITIRDGRNVSSAYGVLGYHSGTLGTAIVDGAGSIWNCNGDLKVGVQGSGSLNISNGGQVIADTLTVSATGALIAEGQITADVTSNGRLVIGPSPSTLHLAGNYTQTSNAILDIQLSDAASNLLQVTDVATLAGTLRVTLFDTFIPTIGDSLTILSANSVVGTFNYELLPASHGQYYLDVVYLDDSVVLNVLASLGGDANGDGRINLADLTILGDNWQATGAVWSMGDFSGDGVVNLADLQILGDHWGYGVTSDMAFGDALVALGLTIPEPAALALLLPLSLMLLRRRA